MIHRAAGLILILVFLTGCSSDTAPPPSPSPSPAVKVSVPADGVELRALGFDYAPQGFSIPADSTISERVNQVNTVVVVLTAPDGVETQAYLRRVLPEQGFEITADANGALLFEREGVDGAFAISGAYSSISLRYDERS
ncbi:MAG: hypothetical protein ACK5KO_08355 [Arachnia sp.]